MVEYIPQRQMLANAAIGNSEFQSILPKVFRDAQILFNNLYLN
jgi:hypothetical protein